MVDTVKGLVAGPLFRFADWPDEQVPRRAAGVYTVWREHQFIYVGMSGAVLSVKTLLPVRPSPPRPKASGPGSIRMHPEGEPETSSTSTFATDSLCRS